MTFAVWCSIDDCTFEETTVPDLETIFDLQDEHHDRFGDHHDLEFDRLLAQEIGLEGSS